LVVRADVDDDLEGDRSWGELHVRVIEHALHHGEPSAVSTVPRG
jgi:hypothetical protein